MSELAHPAWPLLAGAALAAVAPRPARRAAMLAAPALALALAWRLPEGAQATITVLGQDLLWLRADALARAFAVIFALLTGLGGLYALDVAGRRLAAAALVAGAAAEGIVLAGDWITLYAAWEALALASWLIILDGGGPRAAGAAFRYVLVHIVGGALLLGGIAWSLAGGGALAVGPLAPGGPGLLVLLAFAINAAIPPLHAWLTDAYPEAAPAGSVFLSAFATKAAVYALARVFPGVEALVWMGAGMAVYGVVFATIENDLRRLLGYHIVSQVGYMVAGVGLGTPLALAGTVAHAFCHILYKGLLFMGAGAVISATGRRRLSDLGGLARAMPGVLVLYMVGALSIAGAPLLNGFVSKALILEAADLQHRDVVNNLLKLAAVGTFLSVGLKLPWLAFGGPARALPLAATPPTMLAAMTLTAILCLAIGVAPHLLYALLPGAIDWQPYTTPRVLNALGGLAGTALGFLLVTRILRAKPTVTLDADRLYRALGRLVAAGLGARVAAAADRLEAAVLALVDTPAAPARARPELSSGAAVLVAVALLGGALALVSLGRWP